MYENLKGKKLLIMDRTALAACAVERAKELGIKTIVANFYPEKNSPSKQIADEKVDIDISDIDAMVRMINERHVDGIFVGWTDSHLPFYAEICQKTGLPCVGTVEQFNILSNDKNLFKDYCIECGVSVPDKYNVTIDFNKNDLSKIKYPVMVKPADESGGRGIKRCNNEEELKKHYLKLYNGSKSKKIVVEKYIESNNEIFIHYTVQNGEPTLSTIFLKIKSSIENSSAASCVFHTFNPWFSKLYKENAEPSIIKLIKKIGISYGNVMFQGFEDNGKFYFHESGLRPGGDQFYVFGKELNGVSSLDLLIEFALTGSMDSLVVKEKENYDYKKYCCNYYVPLKPGKIASINGIEKVKKMKEVLQLLQFKFVGDQIVDTTSLDRVIFRIHVMADTKEKFKETLLNISKTLEIFDENHNEMQFQTLDDSYLSFVIDSSWR